MKTRTVVRYKGELLEVCTIAGLSEIIGKSTHSIRRYEREGIFPPAPFKIKDVRYYPTSLAVKLKEIVADFPSYMKVDQNVVATIHKLFKDAKEG